MIDSLDYWGKWALNEYYDESSDFWKYAHRETIAKKFYANPDEITDLYHYTTYDSFENIVSSRQFFLGSVHYMNDTQEMDYTFKLLKDKLVELEAPQTLLKEISNIKYNVPFDIYVWCFSENDYSQSLLNYGELALGFKSQDVMDTLALNFSEGARTLDDFVEGNAYVFPLQVEYDLKVQTEYIKTIAKVWLAAFRNINKDSYDMGEIISTCLQAIYLFSLCFKNPYLRQEEEIRYLIINLNNISDFKPDFYIGEKPFVSCNLSSEMLRKVILSKQKLSKIEDVKSILQNQGFVMTQVESTKLPY